MLVFEESNLIIAVFVIILKLFCLLTFHERPVFSGQQRLGNKRYLLNTQTHLAAY